MSLYTTLIKEFLGEAVSHKWDEKQKHLDVLFNPDMAALRMPTVRKDVGAWQWALKKLGYDLGPTGIDNKFGEYTDAATRKFQEDNRTTGDGIAGPITLSIMNAILAKKGITEIPGYKTSKVPVKPGPSPDAKETDKKKLPKSSSKITLPRIENARQIFEHMKSLGYNDIQSAAWVGCIHGESGFNPSIVGDEVDQKTGEKYHSYGIVQWNKERFRRLQKFAKSIIGTVDGWKGNLQLQLDYLGWELEHKYGHVVEKLKLSKDSLEKSLYTIIEHYEVPANIPGAFKIRLPYAKAALDEFSKKSSDSNEPTDPQVASDDSVPDDLAEAAEIERIKYLIKF